MLKISRRRKLTVGLVAVVDLELEIANLPVNVKPEASGAAELEDLLPRAPVVASAVTHPRGIVGRVAVELAIFYARHALGLIVLREWRRCGGRLPVNGSGEVNG